MTGAAAPGGSTLVGAEEEEVAVVVERDATTPPCIGPIISSTILERSISLPLPLVNGSTNRILSAPGMCSWKILPESDARVRKSDGAGDAGTWRDIVFTEDTLAFTLALDMGATDMGTA